MKCALEGLAMLLLLLLAGCQQQMADQPSYKPLQSCAFFADGRSARPLVPGTVARGHLRTDLAYYTGRKTRRNDQAEIQTVEAGTKPGDKNADADLVDAFPFPMTEQVVTHGRDRYMIYCVVCHDTLGTGRGKIVERGYTRPPSYHSDRLRNVPVGHLFAVISEGYGSMPAYGAQIPVRDRWAIVGYLRALQASRHFPESRLTTEMRAERARQEKVPLSSEAIGSAGASPSPGASPSQGKTP